jgi:D-lactate dehydrogenase
MSHVAVFDTKPYDREHLQKAGERSSLKWRFLDFRLTRETAGMAKEAQAVCVFVNDQLDRHCLKALAGQGIRLIALRCAGFNNVDIEAAKRLKLGVTRVPVYSPYAVAEHAAALLLALNRKIHRAFNRVREFNFSLNGLMGFDLHGKTAGIVGTGRIGRVLAEILSGFGMKVLAYDPFPARKWAKQNGVEYVDLRILAKKSDVISLHVPLTPKTRHIIRRQTLEIMKPGVILINVSRGALIDTPALISALKNGRLGGVALDVYEEEEGIFFEDLSGQVLQDDDLARLLTFPNVLITSHQAFLTNEAMAEIARITVVNLEAQAAGRPFVEGTVLTE